jgi:hypothetical protein
VLRDKTCQQNVNDIWGSVVTYIVKVSQERTFGSVFLEKLLSELVKALQLVFGFLDDPFKGSEFARRGTLVQEVDINVFGDGEFAGSNGFQERALSAAVLTKETISSAEGQFQG